MDVKKQNLRKPVFANKRDCSIDAAHTLQGSNISGKEKDTKTQGTLQSRSLKFPPNKPQQVSDPRTLSNNQLCISELKNRRADLLQQLTEMLNENRQLKTLHHHHTESLQRYQNAENGIYMTIVKQTNEVQTLQSVLRQTCACRNNMAAMLNGTEDRLLNTNDSLQELQRLSQDHNLLEREKLTRMLAEASAELEEKDKRINVQRG
ncbi:unnamed protein product [Pleuronectes platessa]|uniref:Lebercilin-like protein n=1 Tax=Pleuronectes platessa TaxID=8262 RepID=A0A9N7V4V3_PLEPL|nr:unnamed protein product [Pleuronectes platessa]